MSTKIEWADLTINPVVGCSKCSPGCVNCYAERFAARLAKNPTTAKKYAGVVDENGQWSGNIGEPDYSCFDRLPKIPKCVFIGSMTDLFFSGRDDTPQQAVETVDGTIYEFSPDTLHVRLTNILLKMAEHKHHTFMVLTKRPEVMKESLGRLLKRPLPNVWLGVTVCNQEEADEKIPVLLSIPAAKRFVSVEPMLGGIDLKTGGYIPRINWIICGGETGVGARPMHPDWVRGLRDQCAAAGTPFFFKSWGDWVTENQSPEEITLSGDSIIPKGWKGRKYEDSVYRVGKRRAGRLLDCVEHNAIPEDVS